MGQEGAHRASAGRRVRLNLVHIGQVVGDRPVKIDRTRAGKRHHRRCRQHNLGQARQIEDRAAHQRLRRGQPGGDAAETNLGLAGRVDDAQGGTRQFCRIKRLFDRREGLVRQLIQACHRP